MVIKIKNKGQVTIFIVIAVLLVASIIILFILRSKGKINIFLPDMPNPQQYIEKCVKDNVNEAINIMLLQGGYLNPSNYKLYKNNKVQYLCYTKLYYNTCINQEPLYIEHLEKEIKGYIEGRVRECFNSLEEEYKKRNYDVEAGSMSLDVELFPRQVRVDIEKKFVISKNEETRKFNNFKIKINNPLYDLAVIASEIVNQESKFCYFEYLGFELLYPLYSIRKTDINGEVKIYEVEEKASKKKLIFAVRSCAFPAGI